MHLYQDCDKKKILLIENAQKDDEICLHLFRLSASANALS